MKPPSRSLLSALPALLLASGLLCVPASQARAADTDFQQWTQVTLQGPLSKRWLGYFEVQPRFGQDASALERLILRPALGYRLNKNVSLWQGYGWTPQFQPAYGDEHRLYQQLLVESKHGKTALTNRTRLEERLIEGAGGTSVRFRHMARFAYPISRDRRWSVIAYDEFFFNLNSTESGPKSGFDQNRLYLGISRQLNPQVRLETGYIWNYVNRTSGPDRSLNVLYTWLAITL